MFNNELVLDKKYSSFALFLKLEKALHIFFDCIHVKSERLLTKFQNNFILQSLTPQTCILGLYNEANDNYNL